MNKEKITALIESAIQQGVIRYALGSPFNPGSFADSHYRNTHVLSQDKFVNTFINEISQENELHHLASCAFVVGDVMEPITVADIAEWILARSIKQGTCATLDQLSSIIQDCQIPYLEVLAICGISPFERTPLTDDIEWYPFEDLPPSPVKDFLTGIPMFHTRIPSTSPYPEPGSALVRSRSVFARIMPAIDFLEEDSLKRKRVANQKLDHLLEVARCLTLFGATSTPILYWIQPSDWTTVLGLKLMDAKRFINSEIVPNHHVHVGGADFSGDLSKYFRLSQSLKDRLRVPIERLNLARRRQSIADQAVELGIAFESLLTQDRDSDAPISFLLRLRGALMVGNTLEQRRGYMKILNRLYSMRSQAVHLGKIKDERGAQDIVRQSDSLCEKLLWSIIEKGSFPDWDSLTLTAGKDWHME